METLEDEIQSPEQKLFVACQLGNIESVRTILTECNVHVNCVNERGQTPLQCAVRCNNIELMKLLLSKGSNVNQADEDGNTPLLLAVKWGFAGLTELFLEYNADLTRASFKGKSPLYIAIKKYEKDIVRLLLERGSRFDGELGKYYVLCESIADGNIDITRRLLDSVKNVNFEDVEGESPLYFATMKRQPKIMRLLLERRANVNITNSKKGYTALHRACEDGDIGCVRVLLEFKANTNCQDYKGNTPLHFAAASSGLEIIDILLKQGANPNIANISEETPLHWATRRKCTEVVRLLLKYKANSDVVNASGHTPAFYARKCKDIVDLFRHCSRSQSIEEKLHQACECGDIEDVEAILSLGTINVDYFGHWLHLAVSNKNKYVTKKLLDNGVDVNSEGFENSETSLHIASKQGYTELVEILLIHNADLTRPTLEEGDTALFLAVDRGHSRTVEVLLNHGSHYTGLGNIELYRKYYQMCDAVIKGNIDGVKRLLENVEDMDFVDILAAETPLRFAVHANHIDLVRLLLEKGANPNRRKNRVRKSILHLAIEKGYDEIVKLLLERNADVNTFWRDLTPLMFAAQLGRAAIMRMLLEQGADVSERDREGYTALHKATEYGNLLCVELLLQYNADINCKCHKNNTALYAATICGKARVLEKLLENGADPNIANFYGLTPLHWASLKRCTEAVKILLRYNARTDVRDERGKTPLDYARKYRDITDLLKLRSKNVAYLGKRLSRACRDGSLDDVEAVLSVGGVDLMGNDVSLLALHASVFNKNYNTQIAKTLLERGAHVDTVDANGDTPLLIASRLGHAEMVTLLLACGADVARTNLAGETALCCAVDENHREATRVLIRHGSEGPDPHYRNYYRLCGHIIGGDTEQAKNLMESLGDVDFKNLSGERPLFFAAMTNRPVIMNLLLENGADVHGRNFKTGLTALHEASARGHVECIKVLLKHNADINCINDEKYTALLMATHTRNMDALEMLLKNGADPNIANSHGATPLHLANWERCLKAVELLLKYNADTNVKDEYGRTPLCHSQSNGHEVY